MERWLSVEVWWYTLTLIAMGTQSLSLTHSRTHTYTHTLTHSLTCSLARSFVRSLVRSVTHGRAHSWRAKKFKGCLNFFCVCLFYFFICHSVVDPGSASNAAAQQRAAVTSTLTAAVAARANQNNKPQFTYKRRSRSLPTRRPQSSLTSRRSILKMALNCGALHLARRWRWNRTVELRWNCVRSELFHNEHLVPS